MNAPSLPRRALTLVAIALGLLSLVHCGGGTSAIVHDGGTPDGALVTPGGGLTPQCQSSSSYPGDRPASVACPATLGFFDAGNVACQTAGDCADAGMQFRGCLGLQCTVDGCLTDSDCPGGQACACAGAFIGDVAHYNRCEPAQCRVNADCETTGICSPSLDGYCGAVTGYYCHSRSDTCAIDADCCGDPMTRCFYAPTLGHFACVAATGCTG